MSRPAPSRPVSNAHPAYAALQDLLEEGGARCTVHFHWLQGGSAFPLPGQPLPPPHVIETVYQKAVLETVGETTVVSSGGLVLD